MKRTFVADIINGEIRFNKKDNIKQYLEKMPVEIKVTIDKVRGIRSVQQNKYYWGCVLHLLSDITGYEREELHDVLKFKFLRNWVEWQESDGTVVIPSMKSTQDLNTKEMEAYINKIREWAASELGLDIPDPEKTEFKYDLT